ncbi:hypothetical protein MBLNU459_g6801t1 [Dothideomycetes sp. NU459]
MAYMDTKRMPLATDQHGHHPLGPQHPSPYTSRPPPPIPTPSQTLPPPPVFHQHPPPQVSHFVAPRLSAGPHQPPPPLAAPVSHGDPHERLEHGYNAPRSGHATPVNRHQQDGPYQRPPSTPAPGQALPPVPPTDRPAMDVPPGSFLPHPSHHPEQQHTVYAPLAQSGPPAPTMMEQHYVQPTHAYAPQYQMYPPNMHMSHSNSRKKSMRASQACDKCRERKSKCDEQRPCSTCKEQNIECHYKDNQPSKTDKNNAAVSEVLERLLDCMGNLDERISSLDERISSLDERLNSRLDGLSDRPDRNEARSVPHLPEIEKLSRQGSTVGSRTPDIGKMSRQGSRNDTPTPSQAQSQYQSQSQSFSQTQDQQKSVKEKEKENTNFAGHSTAVHNVLLLWPSIDPLLANTCIGDQRDYVIQAEERCLLRLYGRGEKPSQDGVVIGAASPAYGSGSDDFGVSPPDGYAPSEVETRRSDPMSDAALNMEPNTLIQLFEKYKKHIHRLHPFLDTDAIGKYLKVFIQNHSSDKYPGSPFLTNGAADVHRHNLKRKRSEAGIPAYLSSSESASYPSNALKRLPERSVKNALLYLVFALGRVCEAENPIPGPATEVRQSNPMTLSFSSNSPMTKLSPASPQLSTIGMISPAMDSFKGGVDSRGSSFDGSPYVERKYGDNVDVIPGLAYYREACAILGDFTDSTDLACAQACLLACLYKGQLGRVKESFCWIIRASAICQHRVKLDNLRECKKDNREIDKKTNLALLAYWSCLQLESDMLAELDYAHSGISSLEGEMPYPNIVQDEEFFESGDDALDRVNTYYTAQLFLRRRLNRVHASLYGVDLSTQPPEKLVTLLRDHDDLLTLWRSVARGTLWNDGEKPHDDILVARLRAKFYGARYVITRPFLDYALHVMDEVKDGRRLEDVTRDAKGNQRPNALALFRAIQSMTEEEIQVKAKICVESAMQSTVAFDKVRDHRLIVTNIMGTAHAQFGNMLALTATHQSNKPWLKRLVGEVQLYDLLERTIKFLRHWILASATLKIDHEVLETIMRTLFPRGRPHRKDVKPGGSFSS